ncbi:MAG: S-methyl-5'-thioadenosine phosphorylase, partial [Anaerolineales bacterium]|nr:S-methyl-5'-thioadenosine phosphorylase [Anaerolineales bacterium]
GSGLYDLAGLEEKKEIRIETPFGEPSDVYITGKIYGKRVAFLPRHGRGHTILPSELNFRANIYGFKLLGVKSILSASAVGSLREDHHPMDFLLPDQFIDRTRNRISTFFGNGLVAHIAFSDPVCSRLCDTVLEASSKVKINLKRGGTYVNMEGPAFSTRAESELYRSWGADLIGMTNLQEAKLAREAEICYVTIAMVTDYDCWHEEKEAVTVESLLGYLRKNSENAKKLIAETIRIMDTDADCECNHALESAIFTGRDHVPAETMEALGPLVGKYFTE